MALVYTEMVLSRHMAMASRYSQCLQTITVFCTHSCYCQQKFLLPSPSIQASRFSHCLQQTVMQIVQICLLNLFLQALFQFYPNKFLSLSCFFHFLFLVSQMTDLNISEITRFQFRKHLCLLGFIPSVPYIFSILSNIYETLLIRF